MSAPTTLRLLEPAHSRQAPRRARCLSWRVGYTRPNKPRDVVSRLDRTPLTSPAQVAIGRMRSASSSMSHMRTVIHILSTPRGMSLHEFHSVDQLSHPRAREGR